MADFEAARAEMVERQLAARGIHGKRLLDAMREVPRHEFVAPGLAEFAYADSPLPIEADQTISQPYIVALTIEAAGIAPGQRVLEIGAGSGYAAAVMGRIAAEVIAIERHAELAELARARMKRLGYRNVAIHQGDGSAGLPGSGPYDAIIVSASGSHVPKTLVRQLVIGGRLVMPVGSSQSVQALLKVTRTGDDSSEQEDLGAVRFVPLVGLHGWDEHGRAP